MRREISWGKLCPDVEMDGKGSQEKKKTFHPNIKALHSSLATVVKQRKQ